MKPTKASACCAPTPARRRSRTADMEALASLAKALGHPARIQILQLLLKRDTCIAGEIIERIPLAQSTVSQHLKVLKDAGLITGCEDGTRVCYCVDAQSVARLKSLVADL